MTTLVDLEAVSIGYGGTAVLEKIDLRIRAGERVAVLGRSGAGKSTLLNHLYGRLATGAALIPQAAALVRALSVFHNVFMGRLDRHSTWFNLRTLARPRRREVAEVETILRKVDLAEKIFAKSGTLSGGQQQRVSAARALYRDCRIAIGDEPVSALDRRQATAILHTLAAAHETLILALHDIPMALEFADRIVVLADGGIALDAPAAALAPADLAPWYGG